jgi:hypothetical protein
VDVSVSVRDINPKKRPKKKIKKGSLAHEKKKKQK